MSYLSFLILWACNNNLLIIIYYYNKLIVIFYFTGIFATKSMALVVITPVKSMLLVCFSGNVYLNFFLTVLWFYLTSPSNVVGIVWIFYFLRLIRSHLLLLFAVTKISIYFITLLKIVWPHFVVYVVYRKIYIHWKPFVTWSAKVSVYKVIEFTYLSQYIEPRMKKIMFQVYKYKYRMLSTQTLTGTRQNN